MVHKITKTVKVPLEFTEGKVKKFAKVRINTTKEKVAGLVNQIIIDDDFRLDFNKQPGEKLRAIGIEIEDDLVDVYKSTPITKILDSEQQAELAGVGSVLVILILFPVPVMLP